MDDDSRLVAGIRERDPEAFRELLERFAPVVLRRASEQAAEEIFLQLYTRPPLRLGAGGLAGWLEREVARQGGRMGAHSAGGTPAGEPSLPADFPLRLWRRLMEEVGSCRSLP